MGSTDLVNGFANRFLFVASRRVRELPFGGRHPLDLVGSLLPSLEDAVKFARGVGLVRRDVHADALWAEVYSGLMQRPPGIRGAATSRAEAQTMRLGSSTPSWTSPTSSGRSICDQPLPYGTTVSGPLTTCGQTAS